MQEQDRPHQGRLEPGGERLNSEEKTLDLGWGRSLGRAISPSVKEQMLVAEGLG